MKQLIFLLLFPAILFSQFGWGSFATNQTVTTSTTLGVLRTVNDSLYYFNYPQSSTGKPIYYWWSSSAGYLYILADSLGVGSAGDPTATGMIKVDSLGDGSLHQYTAPLSTNTHSLSLDSLTVFDLTTPLVRKTSQDWTIEAWVYITGNYSGTAYAGVMGGNVSASRPAIYIPGYNFDGLSWTDTTNLAVNGDSAVARLYDTWIHIAVVNDATDSLKLYQGSVANDDSLTGQGTLAANRRTVTITSIAALDNWSHKFKGYIDEIRIWSTERTLTEINANRKKELVGNESGLLYYYKFNETLTSTATENTLVKQAGTTTYSTEKPF